MSVQASQHPICRYTLIYHVVSSTIKKIALSKVAFCMQYAAMRSIAAMLSATGSLIELLETGSPPRSW